MIMFSPGCTQFVSSVNTSSTLAHNSRSLLEHMILLYYTHSNLGPIFSMHSCDVIQRGTIGEPVLQGTIGSVHMNRDLTSRKCTNLMTQSQNYNTVANINNNDDIPALFSHGYKDM